MTVRSRTLPVLMLVLGLVAGACSGGGTSDASETAASLFASQAPPATEVPTTAAASEELDDGFREAAELGSGTVEPAVFTVKDLGRDIIFVADIVVAVNDVAKATDTATREIAALGGFVFGQSTSGAPDATTVLTFKVFPEDFQEALRRLGDLGQLRTQNISSDDVTERIVDLESRINTAEASVARLQGLLTDAGDIATIAQLENQLLERETTLETLRGQLRTVKDQVSLATIVVTLTEALSRPAVDLSLSAYGGEGDDGQSCPGDFDGLAVDEGDNATLCLEVTNVGDTPLTAIEISDPKIDLETENLVVVFGSPDEVLEPGDSVMFATELEVAKDLRPQVRVGATPVDSEGQPISAKTASDSASFFFDAVDPGGVPSFGEGLAASIGFLARMGRVLVLAIGVVIPFLWIVPVAWLVWHLRRRHRADGRSGADDLVPSS